MKNWDPLSVFKYLKGSDSFHLTFFILLAFALPDAYDEMKKRSMY